MSHDQTDAAVTNAAALRAEMEAMTGLADRFGNSLIHSISTALVSGKSLSDTLKSMMLSLSQNALSAALKPVGNLIGTAIGSLFGNGTTAFADGGIVGSPTLFAMQGGTGLMGEAGPEAIMPLARGPDGSLGVRGGGAHVTVNISTPDVQGFSQSSSQVAAMMTRALQRAQRNM